jgi:ABC-type Fe3+/spermidine/putrescine transport system ATPase subunit
MARVEIQNIRKSYPGVTALDDISLSIGSGEFFTLLGPSGCGKTTLLRTVAGFNSHDSGEIRVEGKRIDDVPAHRRNIGMVYQDYAVFPHMSVEDNVGFGLVTRRVPKAEMAQRVGRALTLVQLNGLGGRMPHELSGGQQQRVALARAMVINPQILLMDEPLSNLDAKLRLELRDEIRDLQRSLGITTLYVTHDQEEALVISDRICIMSRGSVHQVGTPQGVYAAPATLFVASFVGAMNIFRDVAVGPGGEVRLGSAGVTLPALAGRQKVTLSIRPEDVMPDGQAAGEGPALRLETAVRKITYAGRDALYRLEGAGFPPLHAHVYRPDAARLAGVDTLLTVTLPVRCLHAFDAADERRIDLRS